MHLNPGYILDNRYRIETVLGQGGFGTTYKVFDLLLTEYFCLKELFIAGSSTRGENSTVQSVTVGGMTFEQFKKKFLQEAKDLWRFNHPGIVRLVNVFEANNTAYYVMEFIEGETLKQRVQRLGPLPRKMSIVVMQQLLNAVEAVHAAGKLHRDIKPGNVLITQENRIVLIDFGSAREFSDGKTLAQTVFITPGYAPIEQYSELAKRTETSDIYSLGGTLYFVLTGQRPLPAVDRFSNQLLAPDQVNSNVDLQISSAVMLAMEMRAEDRFQRVSDLRDALNTLSRSITNSTHSVEKELVPNVFLSAKVKGEDRQGEFEKQTINTVKIGQQHWMAKNLNVSQFQNGENIPQAKTDEEWKNAGKNKLPAWCYSKVESSKSPQNEKLYNWFAVNDPRGLVPLGFHIPSDEEWDTLYNHLGGAHIAGEKMKSCIGWNGGGNGSNSSGFGGAPCGFRGRFGSFNGVETFAGWWSSTEKDVNEAYYRNLLTADGFAFRYVNSKSFGLSIRCIKD